MTAAEMPRSPGTVYIDRCDLLIRWFKRHRSMKQLPVICRPPRFGKLKFLSICAATYGERHGDPRLPFPRELWVTQPARSLVLVLDFSELDLCAGTMCDECPPDAEMITMCEAFMQRTATDVWARYAPNEVYPPPDTDWEGYYHPDHAAIKVSVVLHCGRSTPSRNSRATAAASSFSASTTTRNPSSDSSATRRPSHASSSQSRAPCSRPSLPATGS